MWKSFVCAIAIVFGLGAAAFAQTCGPQTFTTLANGTTADATLVRDNFTCILTSPKFVGPVGIGTANPLADLDIAKTTVGGQVNLYVRNLATGNSSSDARLAILVGGNTGGSPQLALGGPSIGQALIGLDNADSYKFKIGNTFSNNWLTIDPSTGNVGIKTTSPAYTIDVSGTAHVTGQFFFGSGGNIAANTDTLFPRAGTGIAFQDYWGTTTWAQINSSGIWANSFNNYSDSRLKTNIQPLTGALTLVDALRPVRYQFRNASDRAVGKALSLPADPQVGLVAQEVKAIIPEAVRADRDGVYGINQAELVPVLIAAVKELHGEVETIKAQFAAYQKAHP